MISGELDRLVQGQLERWQVPGLVLGVLADGKTETRGYGTAGADSRLRVASITKPFTAMLSLTLVGEGLLELDAPVLDEAISLRHLLSHQAGLGFDLPDGLERFRTGDGALEAAVREHEGVRRFAAPGELWAYSNVGYYLAGALCARALGTPYEEALSVRVLEPLGLAATSFTTEGLLPGNDLYEQPGEYPRARRPAGGLVSSASDLLRFASFHLTEDPVARAMREPQVDAVGSRMGLGWSLEGPVVQHGGGLAGYRSLLALVPERDVAVVVLASSGLARAAVQRICHRALEELAGVVPEEPDLVELAPEALEGFAGSYRAGHEEIRVRPERGGLLVEAPPSPSALGLPVSEREFVILEGEEAGTRFDFPRPGLARFGLFAQRVA